MSGLSPDTPTNNNPGIPVAHPTSQNPPANQNGQGPSIHSYLAAGVPNRLPTGVQSGTPMDKAPTFPGRKS
jgi:hypothetical protein